MRTTICRFSRLVILAGALVAPALLRAQTPDSTQAGTYVVRPGDTLWRIANNVLGDGSRWREIERLNRKAIRSPQRLIAGTRLVLPPRTGPNAPPGVAAKAPARVATKAPPRKGQERVTRPPARAPVMTPRTVDTLTPPPGVRPAPERSVFFTPAPPPVTPAPAESLGTAPADTVPPPAAVRPWEYVSAPFVASPGVLGGAGRCQRLLATGGATTRAPSVVKIADRMALTLPAGVNADSGSRVLIARMSNELPGRGRVVVPTGVARLTRGSGEPTAEVVAQFGVISCADALVLRLDLPTDTSQRRPARVSDGPSGQVLWLASTALLPSLQDVVITDVGTNAGVKPGDQITLFLVGKSDGKSDSTEVAVANVLRVGALFSSALIVHQSRPAIAIGMPVRVTAKLP